MAARTVMELPDVNCGQGQCSPLGAWPGGSSCFGEGTSAFQQFPFSLSPAHAGQITTASSLGHRLGVGHGPNPGPLRVILWPWTVNKPVSSLSTCNSYDTAQHKVLAYVLAHEAAHDCMARAGRCHCLCLRDEDTEAWEVVWLLLSHVTQWVVLNG